MADRVRFIAVLDVEATCWLPTGQPLRDRLDNADGLCGSEGGDVVTREVIELGICLLDARTLELAGRLAIDVRPSTTEISPYCTELTGMTPERAAQGVPFASALSALCGHLAGNIAQQRAGQATGPDAPQCALGPEDTAEVAHVALASWGNFDRIVLEQQCRREGVAWPFSRTHMNVRSLFALARGERRELSLAVALRVFGIERAGQAHRAADDAESAAYVLRELLARGRQAAQR